MRSLDRAAHALVGLALVAALAACQTEPEGPAPGTTAPAAAPSPSDEPTDEPTEAPDDGGSDDGGEDDGAGLVNGPNTITSPEPGADVAGPQVTVSGEGTAFEGTLNYHVLDAATDAVVVDVDYTMTGANGEIGPWSIDLTLEPGEYTVQVWEPDVSDGESGEGPYLNLVEVTFTVT